VLRLLHKIVQPHNLNAVYNRFLSLAWSTSETVGQVQALVNLMCMLSLVISHMFVVEKKER